MNGARNEPEPLKRPGSSSSLIAAVAVPIALIAFIITMSHIAHAQGCAQCLDTTRATPPSVQAAYRHAIYLLGGTGAALFLVGMFFLRRNS